MYLVVIFRNICSMNIVISHYLISVSILTVPIRCDKSVQAGWRGNEIISKGFDCFAGFRAEEHHWNH